ncbi:MAG: hypothetical protein KDD40_02330, partial [Bdellovibrionales bacterium]|nr:hypothetical protein [Bdellovibrionales bacterium]
SSHLVFANEGGGEEDSQEQSEACESSLTSKEESTAAQKKTTTRRRAKTTAAKQTAEAKPPKRKVWQLKDFLSTDLEENLAAKHPFSVLSAAQKYWPIVNRLKPKKVKDPLYRVKDVLLYPAFTGELESSQGNQIIGQEEAIQELVTYIHAKARGDKSSKMILLVGPGGTGKTEAMTVLDWNRNWLSMNDESFYEWTYDFVHLDKIPSLKRMGEMLTAEMKRSPFTLLREDIQDEVLELVGDKVREFAGYDLEEWRTPDPKAKVIIEEIMKNHVNEYAEGSWHLEDIPKEIYLSVLQQHVKIVRRFRDFKHNPANLVRAVPENPNYSQLFTSEDISKKLFYPDDSPLAYHFRGKVLRQDGGALAYDEFFRNDKNLLNTNLEIAQNGVVETDTGPALKLDALAILTANDESVDEAKDNMALKALIDRMHKVPMRHLLHPYQIAKAFLYTYGEKQFSMRSLLEESAETGEQTSVRTPNGKIEPLALNKAYPLPEADGKLVGIEGRYALYYDYNRDQSILISPHALETIGLTAGITRLVTDVNAMSEHWHEMQVVSPRSHLYTNPAARMKVIMGEQSLEEKVRLDLYRVKNLMREGETGISHRDIESWFKTALELTVQKGRTSLTPMILDEAFKMLIDRETIAPENKNLRAQWLNRYRMVKNEFILPALYQDIRKIVSGDGEKAERLYDQIVKEIVARTDNPDVDDYIPDDGSSPQPIKDKRLKEIKQKFREIHKFEFNDSFLLRHLGGAAVGGSVTRNAELLEAIQAWLVDNESDTSDTANQIADYYEGRNRDPKIEGIVTEAEARMAAYGYDRESFREAIAFWKKLVYEKNTQNPQSLN